MSTDTVDDRLRSLEDEHAATERRLRQLEDERELREVLSLYGFTADLGRSREYTELYAEDGTIDLGSGRIAPDAPPKSHTGHAELYAFITGDAHKSVEGNCQHHALTGPLIFYIDGDDATAEGYSLLIVRSDEAERRARSCLAMRPEINIQAANFNRWTFRRVDGHWRIVERFNRGIAHPEVHDVIIRSLRSRRSDAELVS